MTEAECVWMGGWCADSGWLGAGSMVLLELMVRGWRMVDASIMAVK